MDRETDKDTLDITGYVEQWTSRDGREVILRPIRPDDRLIEKELIEGLSADSSRYRFFCHVKEATESMLRLFCDVDNKNAVAIIAEYHTNTARRNVGVVRLNVDPDQESAEFAILVADDFQGTGLGRKLMETLMKIAQGKKLKKIYGSVLADNYKTLNMVKEFDFKAGPDICGEIKITRQLH